MDTFLRGSIGSLSLLGKPACSEDKENGSSLINQHHYNSISASTHNAINHKYVKSMRKGMGL